MKFLSRHKIFLAISLVFIILLLLFFCQYVHKQGSVGFKQSVTNIYTSNYAHFKEMASGGKLRRGSLMYSFLKNISFIRYFPCQMTGFLKNLTNHNFQLSLMSIFLLVIIFSVFGIPIYCKKIPLIFIPLLGFINLVFIFVFLLFLKVNYSFLTFLLISLVISCLIVLLRLLINKGCYAIQMRKQFRDKENFYLPIVLFLIGLFIISGHLGHLDIPRSYDHMSYSTLSSLLKIEGTYPQFNIYAFPSLTYSNMPSGWIVIVSFISELLNIPVPRTQLILAMVFFPFLGIGVYYICRMIFKHTGWAFSAGVLALAMRMSFIPPTDGDIPEVLEWALVAFALFTLFSYLGNKDKRYFFIGSLSFFVSFMLHIKLTLYTFGGLLFSLPFILLKRNPKEALQTAFTYIAPMLLVYVLALPYILSIKVKGAVFGPTNLWLMEFFENMIFWHGYLLIMVIVIGIPLFIRAKNLIMAFCFAYFVLFFLYFDQWLLWELLKPAWYTKVFLSVPTYFGAMGTYTSFFRFISTSTQIISGFNIVLPILFIYAAYKIIPRRYIKIAALIFVLFLIYESGIRPEVPVQLIGKADFQTAQWIRNHTDKNNTFVANVGSNIGYLWNISGITERKCLRFRPLIFDYLNPSPLMDVDFEKLLNEDVQKAVALLKKYKFTHLFISEESALKNKDFSKAVGLREIYKSCIKGKVSRVYLVI